MKKIEFTEANKNTCLDELNENENFLDITKKKKLGQKKKLRN